MFSGTFLLSSTRGHTRLQGDWSSDVCSSDLIIVDTDGAGTTTDINTINFSQIAARTIRIGASNTLRLGPFGEIGRASCRERVEDSEDADAKTTEDKECAVCGDDDGHNDTARP